MHYQKLENTVNKLGGIRLSDDNETDFWKHFPGTYEIIEYLIPCRQSGLFMFLVALFGTENLHQIRAYAVRGSIPRFPYTNEHVIISLDDLENELNAII